MTDVAAAVHARDVVAQAKDVFETAERLSNLILVDGELREALSDECFGVINPADLSVIGEAPRCREADVNAAVDVAQRAFETWRDVPARDRGRIMERAADRLEAQSGLIERLLALDTGNALRTQARPETAAAIDMLRFFGGVAGELKGQTIPSSSNILQFTTRDPLGVVGAIIPWNAPILLMIAKLGPALVAGNTMVLKSAEQAPLCVLAVAEILQQELPPGVLNVLSGYGEEAGKPLAVHANVRKVTFTGSCPVGQAIMGYVAHKLCPVTLELGGKSPNIIMADADLELAIPGVIDGMRYTRQGQSCTAGSRVFVHEDVYKRIIEGVVDGLAKLRLGNPLDESTDMGAMISQEQFERTLRYMDLARATPGVRILCGGARSDDPALQKGLFFKPTLIDGLPNNSPVCQDEIFGPVACVLPWSDFDEVIRDANASPYGLAAALWTRDLSRAMQFVKRIDAGFVQVNQYAGPKANVAYGGLKMSGIGKEYSLESMLEHFTSSKSVIINQGTPGSV